MRGERLPAGRGKDDPTALLTGHLRFVSCRFPVFNWSGQTGFGGCEMTARPKDGLHRCDCGCKYWEGKKCHSCGQKWISKKGTK